MSDVVLYDYWRSSASYRVRIALALKGIAYERVSVDLVHGMQRSPEHLAINPQGLVPALRIDGQLLTQSLAIIEYLEETRPASSLLPVGDEPRAHVRALALAVACDIHPVSNLAVLSRVEIMAGAKARADWNCDNIRAGLASIEAMLDHPGFTGRYCYGDSPGIADCSLIPQLYNATRWGVGFDHLPRIRAVVATCATHPAFIMARPENFDPSQQTKVKQGEE